MKKYKHLCSSLKHAQPRAGWNSFQTVPVSPAGLTLGRAPASRRPCGAGTRSGRLRRESAGQADPWGERFPRSPARARTAGRGARGAAEGSADEESLGLRSPSQASRGLVLTLPPEMRLAGLSRPSDSWLQAGCLRTKDDSPESVQPCLSPEEAAGAREGARAPASPPLTPQRT